MHLLLYWNMNNIFLENLYYIKSFVFIFIIYRTSKDLEDIWIKYKLGDSIKLFSKVIVQFDNYFSIYIFYYCKQANRIYKVFSIYNLNIISTRQISNYDLKTTHTPCVVYEEFNKQLNINNSFFNISGLAIKSPKIW